MVRFYASEMNDKHQSKISQEEEEKLLRISYEESYAFSLEGMLSQAMEQNKSLDEIIEDVRRKSEEMREFTELEEKLRRYDKESRLRGIRRQQRRQRQEQANQAKMKSKLISFPPHE